eukprot:scaffold49804_cov58-Phaeocystis_antarctica.AAC.1
METDTPQTDTASGEGTSRRKGGGGGGQRQDPSAETAAHAPFPFYPHSIPVLGAAAVRAACGAWGDYRFAPLPCLLPCFRRRRASSAHSPGMARGIALAQLVEDSRGANLIVPEYASQLQQTPFELAGNIYAELSVHRAVLDIAKQQLLDNQDDMTGRPPLLL